MKEIKAIIQPSRLARIRDAFRGLPGFPGMTILTAQGCSAHLGLEHHDTVREELTDFSDKVHLVIVSPDEMVPEIARLILQHAHSGQSGDGLLWVTDVQEYYRLCFPQTERNPPR